jgi:transposase
MAHKTGTERSQLLLLPPSLDDYVGADNPVRIIEAFVDALDLLKLGFKHVRLKETGNRPYHPADLLKLYLYGYMNRIRTSRKLEKECSRNIELMWLLRNIQPAARTICYFRSDNSRAIKHAFREFVLMTKHWGLIAGELLSTDGTKLRAVNSKKNNYNPKKIAMHLERIDTQVQEYLDELDKNDKQENGNRKEDVQKTLRELKERRRKYENLKRQLEVTGEDQVSTTDPESRQQIIRGQITEVAYNVQTTVDSKHNLVADVKAVNTNDKKMASVMGRRAKKIIGHTNFDHLMDKGYHDGETIDECARHGLTTLIAVPAASRSGDIPTPQYYSDKFIYDKTTDSYQCPMGKTLTPNGNIYNIRGSKGHPMIKQYKTRACSACVSRNKCTSSARGQGRLIQRSIYQDAVDKNDKRVTLEKEKYRRRQEMSEHPFGVVKRQWGYDHVLLKGLAKVDAEANLIFLCYNLKRVINILGINELIWRLRKISLFFAKQAQKSIRNWISKISVPEIEIENRIEIMSYKCAESLYLGLKI